MDEQYVVVQTLKTWMDQLLSTDPADKTTVAGIASEIQAAAAVLHRICTTDSAAPVKKAAPAKKGGVKKVAVKKQIDSDEDDETDSGDVDDDLEDSASESEDDESGGGTDDAGSDDSDEAPKKKKKPSAAKSPAKRAAKKTMAVKKQKRPADAPKRPPSAYMIFCTEKRDHFRQTMPAATFMDIAKAMGEQWKNFSAEEKKVYEDKAAEGQAQYQKAMQEYQSAQETKLPMFDVKEKKSTPKKKVSDSSSGTEDDDDEDDSGADDSEDEVPKKKVKKVAGKTEAKNPIKRPLSAYMFFMSEQRDAVRKENPSMSFVEIAKLLAQRWTQLPDADKARYIAFSEADKKRYEMEMSAYAGK